MENNRKLRDTGYLYDPSTAEFVEERARVKGLCFEYNNLTRPSDVKRQHEMLDKILGKHGKSTFITAPFFVDYGYQIEIGDNFGANHNLVILDPAKVRIGNNVLIGCGAKILGPFKVGDGARIAANSVVLSEVPEQATAVGIPAQIVRIAGKATHFADDVDQTSVENPTLERINALSERLDFIERLLDEQYRRGDFPKPTSK